MSDLRYINYQLMLWLLLKYHNHMLAHITVTRLCNILEIFIGRENDIFQFKIFDIFLALLSL